MRDIPQRLRWFSTILSAGHAERVLEVGCGTGTLLALLAERLPRATLVGIDRSALQVRQATQRLATLALPPRIHHLTLEAAPAVLAATPFSSIVAMNVNLPWTKPAAAGAALRALLAPRGLVLLGFEPPTASGRAPLIAKLERAVAHAGFEVGDVHQDRASSAFAIAWTSPTRHALAQDGRDEPAA
ncbi:MAG: class I SAM-dependent methyltransferase [Gemmatimonadetes bacterium]|nr:class I SAM-dependent methyltransferase [Gemmatimonadota bacterium]